MIFKFITLFNNFFSLWFLLVIIIFNSSILYAGNNDKCRCSHFIFSPGYISTGTESEVRKIELSGELLAYFCSGKSIYYLTGDKSSDENELSTIESVYQLGFFSPGDMEKEERKFVTDIKLLSGTVNSLKIFAEGENVYILNCDGILYRINLNSMTVSQKGGVADATLAGMTLVLLEKESGELNINGRHLPLTISGKPRIAGVVDNRLISLTNSDETEIIDVITGESIYQYSLNGSYAVSDEYNLVISAYEEAQDNLRTGPRSMVFYKVSVDGRETGRTETGINGTEKSFSTYVVPGGYHVVWLERWELSAKRNRYKRANNLYQPEKIRIYIPQKRIIKLEVSYNGKEYSYRKIALRK